MVTIIPPKTNVGTQIGQSLARGIESGSNIGFQRGLLQKALGKVKNISPDSEPLEALTALMEAGAGIPGSERYLASLAPLVLGSLRTKKLYGEGGTGEIAPGEGGIHPVASNPAQASQIATKFVEGERPGGFLSAPMNPQQVQDYAAEYARVLNDPQAFDQGLQQANNINQTRLASREAIRVGGLEQGITSQELPRYMQLATKYQHLNDVPSIVRAATDEMLQVRNNKAALENINAPGIYQKLGGVKQHIIPGMTLYKALTSRGPERAKALKGYEELVRNLVNQGEEPFVRQTLAQKIGLSPTEIETLIHPISDHAKAGLAKLPKGNQLNPQSRIKSLSDYFKKNVDNDTSLLVLRDNLINEKGYQWEEVLEAIKQAFPNGQSLNHYQNSEMAQIAQPPIQSLSQLFGPTPNLRGFLRGQK